VICRRGDWIRFYRNNELVIGQVEYKTLCGGYFYYHTTHGEVREDFVLEARSNETARVKEET
jgi:hypothetical protein